MKISIITVVYNNVALIRQCVLSILAQDYTDIEYIIVDGASDDGTLKIIEEYKDQIDLIISEKDNGLYDAMNKGIRAATGDVVGILNSDDFFYDNSVLSKIARAFCEEPIDATIGDIVFIKRNTIDKVVRTYSSRKWTPARFAWGYMPPHPSVFIKRSVLNVVGPYKTEYKISADFELLIRCFKQSRFRWKYLPVITTKMYMGGKSTSGLRSVLINSSEALKACRENDVFTNYFMIYSKYLFKPFEFLHR